MERSRLSGGLVFEDLLRLDLKKVREIVERDSSYTFATLETALSEGKVREMSFVLSWSRKDRDGLSVQIAQIEVFIKADGVGMYLELKYLYNESPVTLRYYFTKRESNLLPGTYRYYLLDPYSEAPEGVCSKLYLWRGDFVPRSYLSSLGVDYQQQREGHTQREVWTPYNRLEKTREKLKYRKTHYRGRETPFWSRYMDNSERIDLAVYNQLRKHGLMEDIEKVPRGESL